MAAALGKPARPFRGHAGGGLRPGFVKLESPVLAPPKKDAGDGHADLDGEFVFRCAHPEALRDMEVRMFAVFPHLQRLDVQVVGPRGQTAASLTAKQPRLSLSR